MKQKLEKLGLLLSRDAQKKILGGERTIDDVSGTGTCSNYCSSDRDCSQDRTCKSAECPYDKTVTIKACFRF